MEHAGTWLAHGYLLVWLTMIAVAVFMLLFFRREVDLNQY